MRGYDSGLFLLLVIVLTRSLTSPCELEWTTDPLHEPRISLQSLFCSERGKNSHFGGKLRRDEVRRSFLLPWEWISSDRKLTWAHRSAHSDQVGEVEWSLLLLVEVDGIMGWLIWPGFFGGEFSDSDGGGTEGGVLFPYFPLLPSHHLQLTFSGQKKGGRLGPTSGTKSSDITKNFRSRTYHKTPAPLGELRMDPGMQILWANPTCGLASSYLPKSTTYSLIKIK